MNNHMVLDVSSDEVDDKKDNFSDWLDEFLEVSDEKLKSANSSDPMVEIKDEEEDDCVILDSDPMDKETVTDTCENDEVLVTGQKGEIACRDFPHLRHDCAKYQFKSTLHQQHCDMCHCYVCDTRAPCPYWYSGVSSVDHCHANDKEEIWKNQREWIRTGITLPRPRSVRVSHNSSSPLTQFGVRACSKSTKVATHPYTSTRPGYRTEQSGTHAVQSFPNQRDGSNMLSKPSPKTAVTSSPYTYRRPSRCVYRPESLVQNIAQGSQDTHYTPPAASQAIRYAPPPALQATRTTPPMFSQAARYAPPTASLATCYAPPPASQATSTNPPPALQAARNAPPMNTRYAPPPTLQATLTNPPASQATRYAPPAALQATRNAAPSSLQATCNSPLMASQATHYAPPVASKATRSAPPAASQATRSAPSVASQAARYAPPVASQPTHSATHYAPPVSSQATRSAPPAVSQATCSAPSVASQATLYAPPVASQATHSDFPAVSQTVRDALPAASQTICNAPPVTSQPTHSASPVASQATCNAPPAASQATRNTPPQASQGNPQRIVTGYISSVPESPSKLYARQFNQKMYSANLQINAVPSKYPNPQANQRQQQSRRSNDKLLSEFEDWLLDDSTRAGTLEFRA